ncbi:MAG: TolC family protein [Pseudomonadota bacterium]
MQYNHTCRNYEQIIIHPALLAIRYLALASCIVITGCAKYSYQTDPIDPIQSQQQHISLTPEDAEFRKYVLTHFPNREFPVKSWELSLLTLAAFYFNPAIQIAQSELDIIDAELIIAGQKPNPTIDLPVEYKTEPGGSPWLFGLIGDFIFERPEKRKAKVDIVRAKRQAKEIALLQLGWSLYHNMHRDMINYYAQVEVGKYLTQQKKLLIEILDVLVQRLEFGQTSEFELSRVRLELQRVELALSNQGFQINDSQHKLFSNTGLLTTNINNNDVSFDQLTQHLNVLNNMNIDKGDSAL